MSLDYDKLWYDLAHKHIEQFETKGKDWDAKSIDDKTKEIVALWLLDSQVNNGGFLQFFTNNGYLAYLYGRQSLGRMEEPTKELLSIHKTFYSKLEPLEGDERIKALSDIPKYLDEATIKEITALDEAWWEKCKIISEVAYKHYINPDSQKVIDKRTKEQIAKIMDIDPDMLPDDLKGKHKLPKQDDFGHRSSF